MITAIVETTRGFNLNVAFGDDQVAIIHECQVVPGRPAEVEWQSPAPPLLEGATLKDKRKAFIEAFEKLYGRKPTFGDGNEVTIERVARDMLISRRAAQHYMRQAISPDFLTKADSSVPWVN